jgi:hypothetical protein
MASPFPGMDPFIEAQEWDDFHPRLIDEISDALVPQVRPRYVVRIERRIYVEHHADGQGAFIRPDVAVLEREGAPSRPGRVATAPRVTVAPVMVPLPIPEPRREVFLSLRRRDTMELVTTIEALSPTNKRRASDGQAEYLAKREAVLLSGAHLVELDLLRGGERLPTVEPVPTGDYYAFVSRRHQRPMAEVYAWSLRQPLPPIPVPLAGGDPDVYLDLQAVFNAVYDRAGYDYSLDHGRPVVPLLSEADATWAQEVLAAAGSSRG